MLVLKRKAGEGIRIIGENGEKIEIKVSDIYEGRVKLGIEAPKSVTILRHEVVDQVRTENKEATQNFKVDKMKLKEIIKK